MGDAGALLERSEELDRLRKYCERAACGAGLAVVAEGAAGIGKTSVLAATREIASEGGLSVHSARAGRLEHDLPWNLVRQLFAGVITGDARARAGLLKGAAALSKPALGLDPNPEIDEAGTLHGLYWLTTALAARKPLLLAVDDAHGGDSSSLRYLSYLAERVADLPVLLTITIRTGEPQPERLRALLAAVETERVVLRPLSDRASATLTRSRLGASAAEEFCSACHGVTGGNPFLLKELLGQLERDGLDPTAEHAPEVARVTPEVVGRAVLTRLSALSAGAHDLARAAVLIGDPAELWEAAALAGLDEPEAVRAADALVAAEILAPEAPLQFVHPLGARDDLHRDPVQPAGRRPPARRAGARGPGRGPEADRGPAAPERAIGRRVGGRSSTGGRGRRAQRGGPQPAVEFLRRALTEPPAPELRAAVLRELATVEALSGSEHAMRHLEVAREAAGDEQARAEIGVEVVLLQFRHGHVRSAVELARGLIRQDAIEDRVLVMRVIAAAVTGSILVPALRAQTEFFLSRIPDDIEDGTPEGRLALSARLADACGRRARMDVIGDLAERTLAGGTLLRELTAHELLYWNATSALTIADRFEAAREAIDGALEDSRRRGSAVGFALCSCFRCKLHQRVGDISAGTADGWQAMESAPEDVPQIRAYTAAFLAECLIERGELQKAIELTTRPEFTGEVPELFGYHLMRVSRAEARIAMGDAESGVDELLEVGEAMGGPGDLGPAASPWRSGAAVGLSMLGRREEARALAEEELSIARLSASGWGQAAALQALAVAAPRTGSSSWRRRSSCPSRRALRSSAPGHWCCWARSCAGGVSVAPPRSACATGSTPPGLVARSRSRSAPGESSS